MNMRQDCLRQLRANEALKSDQSQVRWVKALERDLFVALSGWFSAGLAKIQRVTWEETSGELLENLQKFEAVHKITSVEDLKHRLKDSNRRVFAFCHPITGANEPLVILYVALTHEISSSVDMLIRDRVTSISQDASPPTTAIFYSISSRGNSIGLSQIDLGNHMIRNAVGALKKEHPQICTFSTLSPMPGFRRWLKTKQKACPVLNELELTPDSELVGKVKQHDAQLREYAVEYLYRAKRRGQALDGVANFHLRNGAAIYRVNSLANTTAAGLADSYGYMVNYKYELEHIEERQNDYHFHQKINLLEPFSTCI